MQHLARLRGSLRGMEVVASQQAVSEPSTEVPAQVNSRSPHVTNPEVTAVR